MWPPEVEKVAALVRAAGIEARLEELPPTDLRPPAPAVRAEAYECGGRIVVALVPHSREADAVKVAAAARAGSARRAPVPQFPFADAGGVLLERLLLVERLVWVPLSAERHVLGLDPGDLARLTRGVAADLVRDA